MKAGGTEPLTVGTNAQQGAEWVQTAQPRPRPVGRPVPAAPRPLSEAEACTSHFRVIGVTLGSRVCGAGLCGGRAHRRALAPSARAPQPDALPDTLLDALPDALPDTLPDTLPDALPDALLDALPDTLPDTLLDALPDTLPDALPDAVHNVRFQDEKRLGGVWAPPWPAGS